MRCIVDDLSDAIFGKPRKRSSAGASAPWVKFAPGVKRSDRIAAHVDDRGHVVGLTARGLRGEPAEILLSPHACGVVTKIETVRVKILDRTGRHAASRFWTRVDVTWKDGHRGSYPAAWLTRASAADVAKNPHGHAQEGAPGLDKRKLWQAIERERRKEARAKVRTLREAHGTARATRKAAIVGAKTQCKAARIEARARVLELKARAKREAQEAKVRARTTCDVFGALAGTARGEVQRTKAELVTERAYQRSLRVLERGERERKRAEKRATAAERRSESDDEVRANIPAELRPTFEKVKRQIKGTARKSRTEAFLEWVEEHPAEEYAAIDDATDRAIAEMERRQWQQ